MEHHRVNTPPGRLPLLGDAISLKRRPLQFLESLRTLGELVEVRIGPQRVFVPTTPELTEAVLVTLARHFHKGTQYEKLRPLIGDGLASSEGAVHRRQRALVRQAFQTSRLPGYVAIAQDVTLAHTGRWHDGQLLQMDREMYRLAASVATRVLYNNPIDSTTAREIDEAGLTVVRGLGKRVLAPFSIAEHLPTPANRQYREAVARLHAVVDRIVAERRREDADHGDLLSVLLRATDSETGGEMTDQQVHDEVTTMLGGATESTAVTLSWTLYELARHLPAQERVRRELDQVTAGRPATHQDLPRMPLMFDTLFLAGGACWITAYLLIIRTAARDRVYGMPLLGVCLNIVWEAVFAFIHPYPGLLRPAVILWFSLDLAIVYQTLKFGPALFPHLSRRLFHGVFLLGLAITAPMVLAVDNAFHDPWGVYSAYFENLAFSTMYLAMLYHRQNSTGQSLPIAVAKLAGTAIISLAFWLCPPMFAGSALLHVMSLACFLLDTTYLIALYRVRTRPQPVEATTPLRRDIAQPAG
jgi:cytochrome P450